MGTPCCSWSQARHGPPGSSWCRLRNSAHLWGLPNLEGRSLEACRRGNSQLKFCLSLIRTCCRLRIPVAFESPSTSWMWQVPQLARLCKRQDSRACVVDHCAFGCRWRKRTRIQ
eukprot:2073001-Pyramimonas_sp.AAC.1